MAVLFTLQKAYLDYHVYLSSKTVLQSPVHVLVYGQVLIHALKRVYLIEQSLKAKQAEIKATNTAKVTIILIFIIYISNRYLNSNLKYYLYIFK